MAWELFRETVARLSTAVPYFFVVPAWLPMKDPLKNASGGLTVPVYVIDAEAQFRCLAEQGHRVPRCSHISTKLYQMVLCAHSCARTATGARSVRIQGSHPDPTDHKLMRCESPLSY